MAEEMTEEKRTISAVPSLILSLWQRVHDLIISQLSPLNLDFQQDLGFTHHPQAIAFSKVTYVHFHEKCTPQALSEKENKHPVPLPFLHYWPSWNVFLE